MAHRHSRMQICTHAEKFVVGARGAALDAGSFGIVAVQLR
ncbi:hypothetical protein APY04_2692 [Hyphomicrobium sulfonivorans]|uniref:Uncharacterized protein n=1 Tax=Hyphomicrobium sulfonivorans TaxID=121290 RepID=A0A125NU79_HYPSL|nr:hypothetical protein APY04_2692 [Hyphomicrobium sulfonivorans]